MKRLIIRIIALALAVVAVFSLVACGEDLKTYYYDPSTGSWSENEVTSNNSNNNNNNNNNYYDDGSLAVEVSNVSQAIQYMDEDGMVATLNGNQLAIDTTYTLQLTFTITANADNDGTKYFSTILTFTDINILNGKIKEAETGKQMETTITDASTGELRKDIQLDFKLPMVKDTEKTITISIGLEPLDVTSNTQMLVNFSSEDASVRGSDGISRSFSINPVTLAAPNITYLSSQKLIVWNHVKNATYYKVYIDNTETEIIIDATSERVGDAIEFNIMEYLAQLPNVFKFEVKACSDNTNYKESQKSNYADISKY